MPEFFFFLTNFLIHYIEHTSLKLIDFSKVDTAHLCEKVHLGSTYTEF